MLTLVSIEQIGDLRYRTVLCHNGTRLQHELTFNRPPVWKPERPEPDPGEIMLLIDRGQWCGVEEPLALWYDLHDYDHHTPWPPRRGGAAWLPIVHEIRWYVYAFACGQPVSLPLLLDKRPGEPDPDDMVRRHDGPVLELVSIERIDDTRYWVELDYEGWPLAYMYEVPRPPTWDPEGADPDEDARGSWPATPEARARFAGGVREPMHVYADLRDFHPENGDGFGPLSIPLIRRLRLLVYAFACGQPVELPQVLVPRAES